MRGSFMSRIVGVLFVSLMRLEGSKYARPEFAVARYTDLQI
jgi:hypothetical protein